MAKQLLQEGVKGAVPFFPDAKNIVSEALGAGGKTVYRVPGVFSVCEKVNGNNRRYKKQVWEKNLVPGSTLMSLIERNAAFGLLEHPENGQVTLLSPIAVSVKAAKLVEDKDKDGKQIFEVRGELSVVVGTPEGQKLLALIETGYNPLVSSRGFGSLERAADGVDEVQDDYVCEGWDVVSKPSFEEASLVIPRSESSPAGQAEQMESKCPACSESKSYFVESTALWSCPNCNHTWTASGKPALESKLAAPVKPVITLSESVQKPLQIEKKNEPKSMNINEIKSQITSFSTLNPRKMSQQTFAESMASLQGLHQEVVNFINEDNKRSWQGTKLHEEISDIEKSWAAAKDEPAKRVVTLTEENTKLMKVIKAVAQTGLNLKSKLGESAKAQTKAARLLDSVVARGESWQQLAEKRGNRLAKIDGFYKLACESLDLMATKYKADLTAVGRRVLQLEFKEQCEQPEIKKLLGEATKPKHLVIIREKLEGKPASTKPIAESTPGGTKPGEKVTPAKPVTESKPLNEDRTRPQPIPAPTFARLTPEEGDPRSVNEATEMVRRLSRSSAALLE